MNAELYGMLCQLIHQAEIKHDATRAVERLADQIKKSHDKWPLVFTRNGTAWIVQKKDFGTLDIQPAESFVNPS